MFFLQRAGASRWRVCYQLGLQRLVFIIIILNRIASSRFFQIHPVVSSLFQLFTVVLAISSHLSHVKPCSSSLALSTYLQPYTPIYCNAYLFPVMYRHSSHSQSFQAISCHFQLFPITPSISSHFQPFLPISINFQKLKKMSCYSSPSQQHIAISSHAHPFQPFIAINSPFPPYEQFKAFFSHFQPFTAVTAIYSHFQQFTAISGHFWPFQTFPAISSHTIHSSHLHPFTAIYNQFCL